MASRCQFTRARLTTYVVSLLTKMAPANPQVEVAPRLIDMSNLGLMSEHVWVTLSVPGTICCLSAGADDWHANRRPGTACIFR